MSQAQHAGPGTTGFVHGPQPNHARVWQLCHCWLKRMNILKKTFAIQSAFDYISAPRQAEQLGENR